jgi:hypothetical protein
MVVVFSLAAACGGGGGSGGASTGSGGTKAGATGGPVGTKPSCQFFTKDELKAILGNPVKDGTGNQAIDCFYATDADGGTSMYLTVDRPGRDGMRQKCQEEMASLPGEYKRENLGGVGTSATWVWTALAPPIVQGFLLSCSADSWVMVQLTGEKDQSKLRDTAADIARKAFARV